MKLAALMKKEFLRFFRDARLILSMVLPGVLIYIIYSVMGAAMAPADTAYAFRVYLAGESQAAALVENAVGLNDGWSLSYLPVSDEAAARAAVDAGEADALLVFSDAFDDTVAAGGEGASAELYYNSENAQSAAFASLAGTALNAYGRAFAFLVQDGADVTAAAAQVLTAILPFLIVVFVYSSCMSVTLESVAGEKERGTLSTILVTSARRWDIALGKVIPLACVSLIGAVSGFLGVVLSMPSLMGVSIEIAVGGIGFADYLMIFLLILSFVPLIVAVLTVLSTLSRSVKEASAYSGVAMILVMVLTLVTAFLGGMGGWVTAVPVLNAVAAMQGVLSGHMVVWQCIVSVAANLLYAAALVVLIAKLFSSERVMFGK